MPDVDVLIGHGLVWLLLIGPAWLVTHWPYLAGAVLGWAVARWRQHRRRDLQDQRAAVAKLTARIAESERAPAAAEARRLRDLLLEARLRAAIDRAAVAHAQHRAAHAHARADALTQDLHTTQTQLAAAHDRLALAELDKRTPWTETG